MNRFLALVRAWRRPLTVALAFVVAVALWLGAPSVAATAAFWSLPRDQARIVRDLGTPSYFTVEYLPLGERGAIELVRCEVWYYPEHWQRVSFVAGEVVSVDDVQSYESLPVEALMRPWQIDATTRVEEIADILGLEPVEFELSLQVAEEEPVRVYATDRAVFAYEREALVFFQALAIAEDS